MAGVVPSEAPLFVLWTASSFVLTGWSLFMGLFPDLLIRTWVRLSAHPSGFILMNYLY